MNPHRHASWWHSARNWRPGAYARDGLRIFGWLLLRAAAQAATVLLLARWLGADGYGAFVAALAVASLFTPLAGMGMAAVILRDGAGAKHTLPAMLRRALRLWGLASLFAVIAAVGAMWWSLPPAVPLQALVALAVAEVAAASLVEILARVAQAQQRLGRFGAMLAGLPLTRLAVLLSLLVWGRPAVMEWMFAYAAASLLYVSVLAALTLPGMREEKKSLVALYPSGTDMRQLAQQPLAALARDSAPFVIGALSFRLQAELNKPVLARLSYADAGAYNIAQRAVDIISLPLMAMQESLWPRVFSDARPGRRLRAALLAMLALAIVLGVTVALAAPQLPALLGAEYASVVPTLVALAWLPVVQTARNVGNAALITSGLTHTLTRVYLAATFASVALTLLLVPRYGLLGAVLASYLGEAAAISTQGFYLLIKRKGGSHV